MLNILEAQASHRLCERIPCLVKPQRAFAGTSKKAAFVAGWLLTGLLTSVCVHAAPTRIVGATDVDQGARNPGTRIHVPAAETGRPHQARVLLAQNETVQRTRAVPPAPVTRTRNVPAVAPPVERTRTAPPPEVERTRSVPYEAPDVEHTRSVPGEAPSDTHTRTAPESAVATRFPIGNGAIVERGRRISSRSGGHYLIFQPDGNLVVYDKNNRYFWGIERVPNYQASEHVQVEQGDLRVRDAQNRLVWAALANSPDQDAHLDLTPTGALQLVSPTRGTIWSSDQHIAPPNPVAEVQQPQPQQVSESADPPSSGLTVQNAVLDAHNRARARHGVPLLTWSTTLADDAQQWANRCVHGHAPRAMMNNAGENIAYGYLGHTPDWWAERVDDMYNEIKSYRYDNPGFNKQGSSQQTQTGHFTQIVWQGTTEVGCAWSNCPRVQFTSHMVCRYRPAGNITGPGEADNFRRNVLPPIN